MRFPFVRPPPTDEAMRNTLPVHKEIRPKPCLRFTSADYLGCVSSKTLTNKKRWRVAPLLLPVPELTGGTSHSAEGPADV